MSQSLHIRLQTWVVAWYFEKMGISVYANPDLATVEFWRRIKESTGKERKKYADWIEAEDETRRIGRPVIMKPFFRDLDLVYTDIIKDEAISGAGKS